MRPINRLMKAMAIAACALSVAALGAPTLPNVPEQVSAAVASFQQATETMTQFAGGGTRAELLAKCKAALAEGRSDSYEAEFRSLVDALQHEPAPPKGYDKPPAQRTAEETIRAAIYDLNGDRPYKQDDVLPRDVILAAGTAALGPLMEALDDATPTRAIGEEEGPSTAILLRREDVALHYIEKIAGTTLFKRTQGRGGQFHNDPQRAMFVVTIRAWWEQAKGKSQADLLRMAATGESELLDIAELVGPETVRDQVLTWLGRENASCDGPLALGIRQLDPPSILRPALERFRNHKAHALDYNLLARWGDQAIYRELASQAAADPAPWGEENLAEDVARYGQNWGIPLLATMLTQTNGKQYGPGQVLSPADFAMNHFQKLVGKDFGYDFRGPQAERLAAIKKARAWWDGEGKTALADKIKEPHDYVPTDVFATEAQIAARVAAIAGDNDAAAGAAMAALPKCYSVAVQRALLARLTREKEAPSRLAILEKLGDGIMWQAPALGACFENGTTTAARAAAGKLLLELNARPGLETYETMLASVRHVADDDKTPQELVQLAVQLLLKTDCSLDDARLRRLRDRWPADAGLNRRFEQLEQRRRRPYGGG